MVEMGVRRLGGWMTSGDQSAEVVGSMLLKMGLNPEFRKDEGIWRAAVRRIGLLLHWCRGFSFITASKP